LLFKRIGNSMSTHLGVDVILGGSKLNTTTPCSVPRSSGDQRGTVSWPRIKTPRSEKLERSVDLLDPHYYFNSPNQQQHAQTKPPYFPPRRVAHASLHLFGNYHTDCNHDDEICIGTRRTTSPRIIIKLHSCNLYLDQSNHCSQR
jgi:hypothetical protein